MIVTTIMSAVAVGPDVGGLVSFPGYPVDRLAGAGPTRACRTCLVTETVGCRPNESARQYYSPELVVCDWQG